MFELMEPRKMTGEKRKKREHGNRIKFVCVKVPLTDISSSDEAPPSM